MNRLTLFAAGVAVASTCGAQTLDPSLLKNTESRQSGFHWDFDADKATGKRFTVEGVFCLNSYSWSPIDYNERDIHLLRHLAQYQQGHSQSKYQIILSFLTRRSLCRI